MAKVSFQLVLPERLLASAEADMVTVPGGDGDFGVLPGHIPLVSTVRPGVIELYRNGRPDERYVVAGGFAEVTGERCTVLAEEAQPFADVSAQGLAERARRAEQAIAAAGSDAQRQTAERELAVVRELERAYAYYAAR